MQFANPLFAEATVTPWLGSPRACTTSALLCLDVPFVVDFEGCAAFVPHLSFPKQRVPAQEMLIFLNLADVRQASNYSVSADMWLLHCLPCIRTPYISGAPLFLFLHVQGCS
ncbi:hypothetical protein ABBQ32_012834 [Trebouxia sp. C0010 RCD-2024]